MYFFMFSDVLNACELITTFSHALFTVSIEIGHNFRSQIDKSCTIWAPLVCSRYYLVHRYYVAMFPFMLLNFVLVLYVQVSYLESKPSIVGGLRSTKTYKIPDFFLHGRKSRCATIETGKTTKQTPNNRHSGHAPKMQLHILLEKVENEEKVDVKPKQTLQGEMRLSQAYTIAGIHIFYFSGCFAAVSIIKPRCSF